MVRTWRPLVTTVLAAMVSAVPGVLGRAAGAGSAAAPGDPGCYTGPALERLIPRPREEQVLKERIVLWSKDAPDRSACVLIAADAAPAVRLAAQELSDRCRLLANRALGAKTALAGEASPVPVLTDPSRAEHRPVVLELRTAGDDRGLLPEQVGPEGYCITVRRDGGTVRVLCIGRDARGVFYGAQTLQQLCGVRNHTVVMRAVRITDCPGYRIRCTGNDGSIPPAGVCLRAVMQLPRLKFNAWAVGESYVWPDDWRRIPQDRLAGLEQACRLAKRRGVLDVIFQVHPFRGRPRDKQYNIVISNPRDVDTFTGLCMRMLDAGARGILFRADDYHPLSPEDKAHFGGKAEAHIFLIRTLHQRLKAKHPDYYLIFCPPYYQGRTARSKDEYVRYMQKLGSGVPRDVFIMWTGPVTRSLEITRADIADYKRLIGRDPFLWDNTVYAHRSRFGYDPRHPGYFFDLFETDYPDDYPQTCPGIRYNWGYSDTGLSLTANYTIADYLWNPAGYEPAPSLRSAIAAVYGTEAVDDLIALRDAYYTIKDAVDAGRTADPEVFEKMSASARRAADLLERLKTEGVTEQRLNELGGAVRRMLAVFRKVTAVMADARAARRGALAIIRFDAPQARVLSRGAWTVKREKNSVVCTYPWGTPSEPGAFGGVEIPLRLPPSPSGRYYLLFSVSDDYTHSGTPPRAWPGYLRKQVLANDRLVWEDDVEGREPPSQEAMQVVDVTPYVGEDHSLRLIFRGFDKKGVHNMGAHIRFAGACIVPGPCRQEGMSVEIPNCDALLLRPPFSVFVRFTPRQVGRRESLFAKSPPFQYFGYQHESGRVAAGVYAGGHEMSLQSRQAVKVGQTADLLLTADNGTLRLYLNGTLEGTKPLPKGLARSGGPLRIGAYAPDGPYYSGVIHEFRLFHVVVTPEQAAAPAPDRSSLAGWWQLDSPDLVIAHDLAGNCPDGAVYRKWRFDSDRSQ